MPLKLLRRHRHNNRAAEQQVDCGLNGWIINKSDNKQPAT